VIEYDSRDIDIQAGYCVFSCPVCGGILSVGYVRKVKYGGNSGFYVDPVAGLSDEFLTALILEGRYEKGLHLCESCERAGRLPGGNIHES
jgi:hypothetical protein